MRNYPEWCIAFMAAATAGAIVVPTNSLWNAGELEYGMQDSGTKVLFCDEVCLLANGTMPCVSITESFVPQERLALITPLLGNLPELTTVIGCRLSTPAPDSAKVVTYTDMLAEAHASHQTNTQLHDVPVSFV